LSAKHLALGDPLDQRQVSDLHRGERLDVHVGMALLEPAEHVGVVTQPELGMQPADDVELARRHAARLLGLLEDLLQRPGVGPLLLRHAREGAEDAGVPQDADVGGIDVLIGGEEHAIAVPPAVGVVRQAAQPQEIGRRVERARIGRVQPFPPQHLFADRPQGGIAQPGEVELTGHPISLGRRE
jgi:hypothetical protein